MENNYQAPQGNAPISQNSQPKGYGKKSIWKWIIVYVIVAAVVYGLIYYFFIAKSGSYSTAPYSTNTTQTPMTNANSYMIQGMKVEVVKEGTGVAAKSGDMVTVNYVGTLQNGTKFDSSIDRGTPFSFTLGQNSVIQGWELGVAGMKVGEERKLTIPAELGYGASGAGSLIPPNATILFDVTMLKVGK